MSVFTTPTPTWYLLVPHAESTGQLLASQGHVTEYAKYAGWEHGTNSLRITEEKHGPRVLKGAGVNESFIPADRYDLRVLGAISALMMLLRLDNESLSSHTARSRFSLARERRKAMLLAVDLIRHQPHRLIQGTDSKPESFRLPEFETISE